MYGGGGCCGDECGGVMVGVYGGGGCGGDECGGVVVGVYGGGRDDDDGHFNTTTLRYDLPVMCWCVWWCRWWW